MTDTEARRASLKLTAALAALMLALGGAAWAGGGEKHARMFDHLDANNDEQINRDEIKPVVEKRFKRFDTDGDGVVSSAEIDAHLMKRVERHRAHILKRFDRDDDGAVSRAEFDRQVARMFDLADENDDGQVSREEAREMRAEMRSHWRHKWHGGDGFAAPEDGQDN